MTLLGKPLPHESAREHVTGAALYTDDLAGRFAGLLHAWPVTAPHAHARVISVETGDALTIPGVVRVLTAEDVPGENQLGVAQADEPLFPSEVMFHGQAVAWVLAESEEAARLGALAVEVDYEALPAVLGFEEALEAGEFLTEELRLARGDAKAALEAAPRRLSGELLVGGQEHFYLETQAALAHVDEHGQVFVHSSTQHPTETQEIVARRARRCTNTQVTVQCLRMGGAFGGKEVASQRLGGRRRARAPPDRTPGARAAQPRSGHDA